MISPLRTPGWWLLATVLLAGGACSPDLQIAPTEPGVVPQLVAGTWAYTASEVRLTGTGGPAPCEITGLTLHIEQLRHEGHITQTLGGRTSGGTLTCRGDLSFMSGSIDPYPVTKGNTFNENIAFSIGSDDWRNSGFVAGDSMSGQFWLRHGTIRFEGNFVAKRQSR